MFEERLDEPGDYWDWKSALTNDDVRRLAMELVRAAFHEIELAEDRARKLRQFGRHKSKQTARQSLSVARESVRTIRDDMEWIQSDRYQQWMSTLDLDQASVDDARNRYLARARRVSKALKTLIDQAKGRVWELPDG